MSEQRQNNNHLINELNLLIATLNENLKSYQSLTFLGHRNNYSPEELILIGKKTLCVDLIRYCKNRLKIYTKNTEIDI